MPKPTELTAADIAAIQSANQFQISILIGPGKYRSTLHPSLTAAREAAPTLEAEVNNGRRCMVHAIDRATERAVLVPNSYEPPATAADAKLTAKAGKIAAAKAKPSKKTAKPKPAAKAKADGPSKSDIAVRMLRRKGGAARKDIVAACGGWGVDLKQLAARRGLKLKRLGDGNFAAT